MLTVYRIRRDHYNRTGFFRVCVPEAGHYGIGFQVRIRGVLYGVSIHTEGRP